MRVRKLSVREQFFIVFLLCFLLGIVTANVLGAESFQKSGTLTRYFLKQFQYAQISFYELLWTVGRRRLFLFGCLLLFGMLVRGRLIHFLFLAWSGFAFGYFCVLALGGFGAKGLLLCVTALFPQFFVYVPVYLALATLCMQRRKHAIWQKTLAVLLLFSVWCVGILLESYINPIILQKMLKIF